MTNLPCEQCGGTGFEIVSRDGREFAQACACRRPSSVVGPGGDPALGCRIPPRYEHCTLESFEPGNASLSAALEKAMAFCAGYPHLGRRRGAGPPLQRRQRRRQDPPRGGRAARAGGGEGRARAVLGLPRAHPRDQVLLRPRDEDHRAEGPRAGGGGGRAPPRRPRGLEDDGLDERHALLHPEQPLHGQAARPSSPRTTRTSRARRRSPPTRCGGASSWWSASASACARGSWRCAWSCACRAATTARPASRPTRSPCAGRRLARSESRPESVPSRRPASTAAVPVNFTPATCVPSGASRCQRTSAASERSVEPSTP